MLLVGAAQREWWEKETGKTREEDKTKRADGRLIGAVGLMEMCSACSGGGCARCGSSGLVRCE